MGFSAGSKLEQAIADGPEALQKYIASGEIEELHDVMPINDDEDYLNDDFDDKDITSREKDLRSPLFKKDSDMRNMGDIDFRSKDVDLRRDDRRRDFDMRNLPMDEDFRYNERPDRGDVDEDFRNERFRDDDDFDGNYYDDGPPNSGERLKSKSVYY